jgi:hypothetical protein
MANTKKLDRPARKKAKRGARKELRKLSTSLTRKERAEFRKADEKGLKAFVLKLRAKQKQAAEAPAAEGGA